jgi:hypothetical protein
MKCPGQDPRFWKFDAIFDANCPKCGNVVEFFKDETKRRCKKCGHQVLNPKMDFGCAAHCKFAEHCFGDLPPELVKQKEDLFKDRIAIEMKLHLKNDFKRIGHGSRVARYVDRLVKSEKGDPAVALSVAYLREILDFESEHERTSGGVLVKKILEKLNAAEPLMNAIQEELDNKNTDSENEKLYQDALKLAEMEQEIKKTGKKPSNDGNNPFFTHTAGEIARELITGAN